MAGLAELVARVAVGALLAVFATIAALLVALSLAPLEALNRRPRISGLERAVEANEAEAERAALEAVRRETPA